MHMPIFEVLHELNVPTYNYTHIHLHVCVKFNLNCTIASYISRLTVVSREAKKKQHARASSGLYATTTVSYLHEWQL